MIENQIKNFFKQLLGKKSERKLTKKLIIEKLIIEKLIVMIRFLYF